MRTRRRLCAALACSALQLLCLQAHVLPYTPSQSQCLNPDREYYEESINKCCSLCPPGFLLLQGCNHSANTQCAECQEGMYKKAWSRAGRCFSCSPRCKEGFVEEMKCTRTQNRACWCPPDHFCSSFVSEKCYNCQPYQKCQKGYGAVQVGKRKTDVVCAPCRPGTFSDHESHTAACTPHRSGNAENQSGYGLLGTGPCSSKQDIRTWLSAISSDYPLHSPAGFSLKERV
ncbi:tumor necrosis factor receptor superfamily member 1B-like [Candoia aspera]|uniref:tumor necrosis factor receptor superfamily member 1B-like n=1 Tax=Candoia aspera TaxID=51853 RepID=UPI002FD7DF8D